MLTPPVYGLLLQNQWRLAWRSFRARYGWFAQILIVLLVVYFSVSAVIFGFLVRELLRASGVWHVRPVDFINAHLLTGAIGLFVIRFFLQRSPRMRVQALLHLPIPEKRLVGFFQVYSLVSFHNLLPFLFVLAFWARYIEGRSYETAGVWMWLAGVVLLILFSQLLNHVLRALLAGRREGFFLVLGVLLILVTLDLLSGFPRLPVVSTALFGTLLEGNPIGLSIMVVSAGIVFFVSGRLLQKSARREFSAIESSGARRWTFPFLPKAGVIFNLMQLELKLMWRCERPKLYFLFSVIFGTLYLAAPLIDNRVVGSAFISALITLYASGIFAMNYGQLMFAWESSYFDGVLTRRFKLEDIVLAKLLLLQYSCAIFFFMSLPLFAVLAPDLIPLHVAFVVYNAGVTCVLMLFLAIGNEKRVELAQVGFFNFEGFSIVHWLWFLPTVVPPAVLIYFMKDRGNLALLILWGVGMTGLLLNKQWSRFFARQLRARRYIMSAGFRKDDS